MKNFVKSIKISLVVLLIVFFTYCSNNRDGIKWDYRSNNKVYVDEKSILENYSEMDDPNTEEYSKITENTFKNPLNNPLSTFSIDVDNASYSNVRRFINDGLLPPTDAVRIEEMINYFSYDYGHVEGEHPFVVKTEMAECPWTKGHQLVHIGIKGKALDYENTTPCNLVFLIDVSGSMSDKNKLPLLKDALMMLTGELSEKDKVSIVAYAGAAGVVLPSTSANRKKDIAKALSELSSGGSTAGGRGIELAYKIAKENFIEDGNNRVILATDGDFNVGTSSSGALVRLIEEKRDEGVYLTICGFGMGNYKDSRMEDISNAGNGNYFYIDNIKEAEKVFVTELRANLFTIAKDVKIQVEFNPDNVQAYRLIGYENRVMNNEDFDDDKKDAGEIGAGHTVTAIYEIIPTGITSDVTEKLSLKYQQVKTKHDSENEMMTLKFRYKPIESNESVLIKDVILKKDRQFSNASEDFRFSAAVACFGMLLRDSDYKGNVSYNNIINIAKESIGDDKQGYRNDFIQLVKKARTIKTNLD